MSILIYYTTLAVHYNINNFHAKLLQNNDHVCASKTNIHKPLIFTNELQILKS